MVIDVLEFNPVGVYDDEKSRVFIMMDKIESVEELEKNGHVMVTTVSGRRWEMDKPQGQNALSTLMRAEAEPGVN